MNNQDRLQANQNRYQQDRHGVPRKGQALLQGLLVCGRCGARMSLRYSGPHGEYPVYDCTRDQQHYGQPRCQAVRALGLDAAIAQIFLQALAPDNITVVLAAFAEAEQEAKTLQRHRQLRRERAQYEVDRARRQYHLVEPLCGLHRYVVPRDENGSATRINYNARHITLRATTRARTCPRNALRPNGLFQGHVALILR